ncbi:penicillin-binding protein 2 [Patescibacteria group bacterium]
MNQNPFWDGDNFDKKLHIKQDKHNWLEDSFSRRSWLEKNTKAENSSFLGITVPKKAFIILKAIILIVVASLSIKLFYLQIVQGAKYKNLSETNRIKQVSIISERGILYDRNQKPLVVNVPNFYLMLLPNELPKETDEKLIFFQKLSDIINIESAEIEERLDMFSKYQYQSVPIVNNLSYEQTIKLELLNNAYPAAQIGMGMGREYEIPDSLSHIIGFLGKVNKEDLKNNSLYLLTDDVGKDGVELYYENVLRGTYGKQQIEVDALGRQTLIIAKEDPIPGDDIILTIDSELQKRVESILKKHLRANNKTRGAIIISKVDSGEILSMVSLPAYKNSLFSSALSYENYEKIINNPDKPLFNRAIAGEYPSGSTVKPVFAAAALEEGLITQNTKFISRGGIKVNQWFFPDWKIGGHGRTDVRKALAESVNTFFYIIGGGLLDETLENFEIEGLGVENLTKYAKKFGLSNVLNIDLPGEANGLLPTKKWKEEVKGEPWYIGDTYHLAIGQGDILVTPLQVNFWTAVFANGGTLYQPHILKTILHYNGSITSIPPQILNTNFIQKEYIDIINKGLRDSVLYGSSVTLNNLGVTVAGKTGTAQWQKNKTPHAWFTGFAPYNNPEIAITVLVEEGGEGSKIAVPIAKEILWWYFNS